MHRQFSGLLKLAMIAPAFLAACLIYVSLNGRPASLFERAQAQGRLTVGMHHVAPPYAPGAKFRTPEGLTQALAEDIAKRLHLPLATARIDSGEHLRGLSAGKIDVALAAVPVESLPENGAVIVPAGPAFGPMAIMRTDTDIKSWVQLKGRKVCVSEGGLYGGMAVRYGAHEQVYKAPADSLLALRIGACDAALHDSAMLEELIKLPEWKKFSARLPTGPLARFAFILPAEDNESAVWLKKLAYEWRRNAYVEKLLQENVRHIAFEVYLDQNVPDCH